MTSFSSRDDFQQFADAVRTRARFVHDEQTLSFLKAVERSVGPRVEALTTGTPFWRAQLGTTWRDVAVGDDGDTVEVRYPFDAKRMMPQPTRARENRANPHGIPVVYCASHRDTAIAEVGARKHSTVSVARLRATRDLRVVNATVETDHSWWLHGDPPDAVALERMIWGQIDFAFMRPVTRTDDVADYAPTQVLADLFRHLGFDGVVYASSYGAGHNIALFALDSCRVDYATVARVTDMKLVIDAEAEESYSIPDAG